LILLVAVLLAGCGDDDNATTTATAAPTSTIEEAPTAAAATTTVAPTTTVPSVEVVRDLAYQNGSESNALNRLLKLLDIYVPSGVQGAPVVVLLHGAGYSKDGDRGNPDGPDALKDLATAAAEQGAVAFVPTWNMD